MDKREQDVLELIRKKTADVEVPKSLEPDAIERILESKEAEKEFGGVSGKRRNRGAWQKGLLAAACLTVVAGVAAWNLLDLGQGNMTTENVGNNMQKGLEDEVEISSSKTIAQADSYEQIYDYYETYRKKMEEEQMSYQMDAADIGRELMTESSDSGMNASAGGKGASRKEEAVVEEYSMVAPADTVEDGNMDSGYSQTNVRQEGVDEADIAKTDGRYLYILEDSGREIAVVDTKDGNMKKVTSVKVDDKEYIREFYVVPDRKKMVLVCGQQDGSEMFEDPLYTNGGIGNSGVTMAVTYDIKNPEKPEKEGKVTQSGQYSSSRMVNGFLYLFSEVRIWGEVAQNEPRMYVPLINGEPVSEKNIYLPPIKQANMYEVITSVNINKPDKTVDSKAIFSKGGQAYVSNKNIYFYETEWGYWNGCVTTIRKVAYKDGKLEAKAQGKFDGYLNDSFSIDEYEGNLRVVTTDDDTNSVYVLDEELTEIGAIENLAKDERIYSARFMGDTGYFVTFRETDPLFSVDLSDPKKPKIIGELKIPGFSEYLHFYGEDRLLGIGMNVDEKTMTTDGAKITMFDISDKADVKEKDTYVLKNVYSTDVAYDYKAALVDWERNIIGFSGYTEGGQRYFLFAYDEDEGFICNMEEDINGNGMWVPRGIYIGDTLYVIQGNIIEAYSLKDYQKVDDLIL
ncbi:hypothetical protein IMSAGC018_00844 [Lachnospiraceae bacterium]|nr:hypothetical protein IMSAGC018_00844 [Lachnospiraceae bacterium]